jgi:hypothetical protein
MALLYDDDMLALQTADPMGGMLYGTKGSSPLPYEFHVYPSLAGTGWGIIINSDPNAVFSRDPMPTVQVKHKGAWVTTDIPVQPLKVKHKDDWLDYADDGPDTMRVKTSDGDWVAIGRRHVD